MGESTLFCADRRKRQKTRTACDCCLCTKYGRTRFAIDLLPLAFFLTLGPCAYDSGQLGTLCLYPVPSTSRCRRQKGYGDREALPLDQEANGFLSSFPPFCYFSRTPKNIKKTPSHVSSQAHPYLPEQLSLAEPVRDDRLLLGVLLPALDDGRLRESILRGRCFRPRRLVMRLSRSRFRGLLPPVLLLLLLHP